MIEYQTEPCNSLNREANFFGVTQTLFFLWIGVAIMAYIIYFIVSLFKVNMLTNFVLLFESTLLIGVLLYLKKKGSKLVLSEIQKAYIFLSRPKWVKAKN
jgi:hypothetical protein